MKAPSEKKAVAEPSMRMAELSRRSGVARETIHYYLREGLLPRPRKGGRTVAYYDDEHLERLRVIRRLREEKYLPLAVIRRLFDSQTASAERDVEVLSDVLHLDPTLGRDSPNESSQPRFGASALAEALDRGLLGPMPERTESPTAQDIARDSAKARVVSVVEEADQLESHAREFTLRDLEGCAKHVELLVEHEAELFFDTVLRSADIAGTIAALRAGRGTVARFIAAYRDLMLRRIVDDLLLAVQHGPVVIADAATVPLSAERERQLGTFARRAALIDEMRTAPDRRAAATRYIWHLFGCGAIEELAAVSTDVVEAASGECAVLVAWGRYESARNTVALKELERAAAEHGGFALGQILAGEAKMRRGVRRRDEGASILEGAIPALNQLVIADPDADEFVLARAYAHFYRGRVDLVVPKVLGRRGLGVASLQQAIALLEPDTSSGQGDVEPAASIRLRANANLLLGRYFLGVGESARALSHWAEAQAADPDGPIGAIVREHLATRTSKQ